MNKDRFQDELTAQYTRLFQTPDYAYARLLHTPATLAAKMTASLATGAANKDGEGIKRTCKALGVAYTYKAIRLFLEG